MEEIKTYREMDMIRSNMREYKDGEWVKYSDHKAVIETMQNKIDELKAVIGGEYTGYYCAEHGAINGVEVTFYEKCAICGRDANHVPKGIK